MYIRIVHGRPQPGQVDEVARRWKVDLAPRLASLPGFRHGYFSGDREANRVAGVTVWDDRPGEVADEAMREFGERVRDITTGPPTMEDNEVLAEV